MRVFKTVYGAVAYAIFATFVLLSSPRCCSFWRGGRSPAARLEPGRRTPAGLALAACSVAGWLLVLVATFQIDHFELTHLPAPLTAICPPCAARRPAGTASRSAGGRWRR